MIVDNGCRTEFSTGAVRDMHEGTEKGRMDLVPLEIVGGIMNDPILKLIGKYIYTGSESCLTTAFKAFVAANYVDIQTAVLEVSIHYFEGGAKYSERNWEKGIPLHSYIDSACRHYVKHLRGDKDERHDRAFLWNILGALWTAENKPEMNDLPWGNASDV
jgi:hypothetical protein